MQYINPNYQSWCALSLIDDMLINTDYVNNAFVAYQNFEKNKLYLLINNDGSNMCLTYIEYLQNLKEFNKIILLEDIDLCLIEFKLLDNKFKDYMVIINGQYDKITKEFNKKATTFIADCVRKSPLGFLPLYKILFLIIDNSSQLLTDYWLNLYPDNNWLLEKINEQGVYFSKIDTDLNNVSEMNFFKNYYNTYLN